MATGGGARRPTFFPHRLPPSRLGQSHATLQSYLQTVHPTLPPNSTPRPKSKRGVYSLVVVTETSRRRILLGLKNRGFGTGLYNAFGGKLNDDDNEGGENDNEEGPTRCAVRELREETNIDVSTEVMDRAKVGTVHFTFDDEDDFEMLVHLYRIDLVRTATTTTTDGDDTSKRGNNVEKSTTRGVGGLATVHIDPTAIRGCEEITPRWFDDWTQIPLDNMFADDSIWLTEMLALSTATATEAPAHYMFDGWFHFCAGGAETNSVMHYHMAVKDNGSSSRGCSSNGRSSRTNGDSNSRPPTSQKFTLEKRLFHELHQRSIHSPTIKEFKECWAFASAVKSHYGRQSFDVVIDVAGGHGALAALLLILTSARYAVVVDPAVVGGQAGVRNAWGRFYDGKELRYRNECLRTGLRAELEVILGAGAGAGAGGTDYDGEEDDAAGASRSSSAGAAAAVDPTRVLVVACHACQHLTDETVEIATDFGVHVAVMPCCQKDNSAGGAWKAAGKNLGIPVGTLMDLLAAGKVMAPSTGRAAGVSYDVRMKQIDKKITPQNRLILCRARKLIDVGAAADDDGGGEGTLERAHRRLQRAYDRAHRRQEGQKASDDGRLSKRERMSNDAHQGHLCL